MYVMVTNSDHPDFGPAMISEHPGHPGVPLTLDMAREILEACAEGASMPARLKRRCRTAQPGDVIKHGPVELHLLEPLLAS